MMLMDEISVFHEKPLYHNTPTQTIDGFVFIGRSRDASDVKTISKKSTLEKSKSVISIFMIIIDYNHRNGNNRLNTDFDMIITAEIVD